MLRTTIIPSIPFLQSNQILLLIPNKIIHLRSMIEQISSGLSFGELMALITAVIWAIAIILLKKSGEKVHPLALNLFKNTLAFVLFIPTIIISKEVLFYNAPSEHYWMLILSGILGIAIADVLFLKGLNLLGAGMQSIVSCMYSPSIIFLSFIWLGERMTTLQIIGAILIVSAVLTAASKKGAAGIPRKKIIWGLVLSISSHVIGGIGLIMIKPILEQSPLLWVTEVRLLGGVVFGFLILLFWPNKKEVIKSITSTGSWGYTISGSIVGAYIAMMFWLAGMKYAQASIAAALNQTSNIFVFVLAVIILKEPINQGRIIGIILGMTGAILVTFG